MCFELDLVLCQGSTLKKFRPGTYECYMGLSPIEVAHTPKFLPMQSFWFVVKSGFFFPQSYRVSF